MTSEGNASESLLTKTQHILDMLVKGEFVEGMEKLRQFPDYTFVEYGIDIARSDNFKGVPVVSDNPQLQCLVGVPG